MIHNDAINFVIDFMVLSNEDQPELDLLALTWLGGLLTKNRFTNIYISIGQAHGCNSINGHFCTRGLFPAVLTQIQATALFLSSNSHPGSKN